MSINFIIYLVYIVYILYHLSLASLLLLMIVLHVCAYMHIYALKSFIAVLESVDCMTNQCLASQLSNFLQLILFF